MNNINNGINNEHLVSSTIVKIEVELIIDNTNDLIKIISFLSDISNFVQKLYIYNTSVLILERNIFDAYKSLEFLRLDNVTQLNSIHAEILKPFSDKLKILEIYKLKFHLKSLYNLTGSVEFPQLKNVSFVDCLIPFIQYDAFLGLSNVTHIVLVNCKIEHIAIGAFDAIQNTILYIDLSNNYLASIDGVFRNWYHLKHENFQINVKNNPIDCYGMGTFVEFIKSHSLMFAEKICQHIAPEMKYYQNDAIVCDEEGYLKILDENKEEPIEWNITNTNDGTVLIKNINNFDDGVLLWLDLVDNKTNSISGCLYSTDTTFIINDLKPSKIYTFCAMQKGKSTVSPYNCLPYYHLSPEINENNMWLSTNDRTLVISIMTIVYICCIAIGIFIAYCILKHYPTLLKGGNGVVVVRNSTEFMQKSNTAK